MRRLLAALLLSAAALTVAAQAPAPAPPAGLSAEQADALLRSERFRTLAEELRCLVCQNQTLADSSAELAVDLRNEVLRQMAAGRNDAQIKDHLVARYGEFVLYRPTFSARNLALWLGPAVLLAIGAVIVWRIARRPAPRPAATAPIDDERVQRIDRLLREDAAPPRDGRPR